MAKFPRFMALPIAAVVVGSACGRRDAGAVHPRRLRPGGPAAARRRRATGATINVTSLWGGAEATPSRRSSTTSRRRRASPPTTRPADQTTRRSCGRKITGGNPPDVAIMPGIGFLGSSRGRLASRRSSDLGIDPASLEANYPPGILDPAQVDGEQYGLMVKFNSKSTFCYRPDVYKAAGATEPKTWDDFKATDRRRSRARAASRWPRRQGLVDAHRLVREHLHPSGRC